MRGSIQKESWSKCDHPYSLYETIRNPKALNAPLKIDSLASKREPDTIESTQKRLHKEMLNKLESKGLQLPHSSFVAVVQVAKYVFLAIMLPPYLCLYGIPKFLLFSLIPQALLEIRAVIIKIGHFFKELTKTAVEKMKGLIDQLLGEALKLTNYLGKNLCLYLLFPIKKLFNTIFQGFKKGASWPKPHIESIKKSLSKKVKTLFFILGLIPSFFLKVLEKIKNFIKKILKATYTKIKSLIYFTRKLSFPNLMRFFKTIYNPQMILKSILRVAKNYLQRISSKIKEFFLKINKMFSVFFTRLKNQFFLKFKIPDCTFIFIKIKKIINRRPVKLINSIYFFTKAIFSFSFHPLKSGFSYFFNHLNKFLYYPKKIISFCTDQTYKKIKKITPHIKVLANKTDLFLRKVGFKIKAIFVLCSQKIKSYFLNLPKKIVTFNLFIWKKIVQLVKNTFFALRLLIAILSASLIYGFSYLHRVTSSITTQKNNS